MAEQHIRGALLLYHRPAFFKDAATITDHIEAFERYSRFPFWRLNTDPGFPRKLAGLSFDAIVLHYSLFAAGPDPYLLDRGFLEWLDSSGDSYKVAFFQDEHQYCQKRFAFLDRYRVDCVYTCIEPEYFDATYRRYTKVPTLVSHVPAYVSPDLVEAAERLHIPDAERPLDVGYRARPTPPYLGRGGVEKVEIGERFAERAAGSGLGMDISTREQDRLYGEDWYRFLASCRGFLGTESGASCVDLEDEVREEYERLAESGEAPTLERLEQGSLGRWDWKVPLRTTSSRHFEAAALRSCQIMYEGRYSGALRPMEHYLPLKKDFSNFDHLLGLFRDPDVRRELTDNAYRDLIASGAHSYESFIAGFDRTLIDAGIEPGDREPQVPAVRSAMRRRPVSSVLLHYLSGVWVWLERRHPRVFRVAHVVLRPIVIPLRALTGRS